jgi:predicted phosphate transport protein (TIGR00153 family)
MKILSSLFGKSPFGALLEHTKKVHECVKLVQPLIEVFLNQEFDKIDAHHNEIAKLEHEADMIKTEIRRNLGKSYFLAVDRSDLLHFLHTQDEIADAAKDIAVLCNMRNTRVPQALHQDVLDYVQASIKTSEQLLQAAESMNDLLESAFGGPDAEKVLADVEALNKQEWAVDRASRHLLQKMFSIEDQMNPIDILMMMKILKEVGNMANNADNTGEHLALMILRR